MDGYGYDGNRSGELTEHEVEQLRIGCASIHRALRAFVGLFDGTGIDTSALRVSVALTEAEVERVRP